MWQEEEVLAQLNETRLTYRGQRILGLTSTGHYYVSNSCDAKQFPPDIPTDATQFDPTSSHLVPTKFSDLPHSQKVPWVLVKPPY